MDEKNKVQNKEKYDDIQNQYINFIKRELKPKTDFKAWRNIFSGDIIDEEMKK